MEFWGACWSRPAWGTNGLQLGQQAPTFQRLKRKFDEVVAVAKFTFQSKETSLFHTAKALETGYGLGLLFGDVLIEVFRAAC